MLGETRTPHCEYRPARALGWVWRWLGGALTALAVLAVLSGPGQAAPAEKQRIVEVGVFVSNIYEINFTTGSYKASFWL